MAGDRKFVMMQDVNFRIAIFSDNALGILKYAEVA